MPLADQEVIRVVAAAALDKPPGTLEAVETIWPEIQQRWEAWALSLTDADLAKDVSYKLMDGSAGQSPAWQIVLHVVNHGTLHRGQVMAMLRQLGHVPPGTDYLFYHLQMWQQ